MDLKKLFTRIHILLILLLITLGVLSVLLFQNKSNFKKSNKSKLKSFAIASKLRGNSDKLTRYSRTYVLTGDTIWKQKYFEILAIRNGEAPWPNGRIISTFDTLKKFNFTLEESQKLNIAEQNSNKLAKTEITAINAVKSFFDDGTENFTIKKELNTQLASSTLFDKNYHESKAKIMQPIEDFYVLFNKRTQQKIDKYDTISYWLLGIINTLIVLIIIISTISYITIKNKIIYKLDELKKAKETAEETAQENIKLSIAIEQSSNSVVITDTRGNIEYTNPKFTERTGYTAQEVLGKNQRILKSGNQTKEYYTTMWETIKAGKTWKGEFYNKAKDGSYFWEHLSITSVTDNNGEIVNYLAIKEDITALKENETNLVNAQELAKMGSFNLDLTTQTGSISDAFNTITGFKTNKKGISLSNWRKILHPEDLENNIKVLQNCIKNHEKFDLEYRIITKDTHQLKWIHGLGEIIYNDDKPINFIGTLQDITERKQQELLLKESESNLVKAQEIAKIGSFNLDLRTQLAETSLSFDTITGFTKNDIKTLQVWRAIMHPDDAGKNKDLLEKVVKSGEKYDREYRILTNDTQELKWVHSVGEVTYENGEPRNFTGTIQDITERKSIEEELIASKQKAEESNRLKTEFLNNMSHEIRTPMNGILGFSDMLAEESIDTDKRKYFVNIIQNSGKQLLRIIDDIIEISRLGTKQINVITEEVCLNDLFLELFSVFDFKAKENKTPLYLKKGLSDKESTVFIDKSKLNKILSNLLENALKFTNNGCIEFGYELQKNNLKIYVKDTGIGIHKSEHQQIFDRFSQAEKELSRKIGGLGLGLSIAKENAELLGGEIFVESTKGEGATFYVVIPYKPTHILTAVINETNKKKYTILIAEDEEVNYLYLETILVDTLNLDVHILHAKNGIEAVDICESNSDIQLVFMDLKMPVLNGFEATKKIKKLYPNLPIIAQTAYSTEQEKESAILAGCDDFISKPIDKETILNLVEKYLLKPTATT